MTVYTAAYHQVRKLPAEYQIRLMNELMAMLANKMRGEQSELRSSDIPWSNELIDAVSDISAQWNNTIHNPAREEAQYHHDMLEFIAEQAELDE